jgi:hypothetical protein
LLEKSAPLPTSYYEGVIARYKDLVKHCSFWVSGLCLVASG